MNLVVGEKFLAIEIHEGGLLGGLVFGRRFRRWNVAFRFDRIMVDCMARCGWVAWGRLNPKMKVAFYQTY
ncbi:MAG: hypothetical protein HKL95_09265 [Phycisphaerae bacterium]|nr:hypothetical protein [Phycisphaerae bacterium]